MTKRFKAKKIPIMRAGKMVQSVKKLIKRSNAEQHIMNNESDITLAQAGTITYLSTIAEGDNNEHRTGAKITPDELSIRIILNTGATTQTCRYIVFQDTQCYGAAPAVGDVLHGAVVNSQYNVPNMISKRFRILYDKIFTGVNTDGSSLRAIVIKKRKMNAIQFTGTGLTAASAGRGALFLLRLTNVAAGNATDFCDWTLKFHP